MHYHKIKMTAAAMAMAVLVTGNMPAAELNTATVSAKSAISAVLPAAGVGLVLNDGVSVSQIREEIKKRKEEKEPAEPVASSDTKASVTQTVAESATEAEAAGTSDMEDSVDAPEHASESVEKCEGGASHD